jgi:hypothetical protein
MAQTPAVGLSMCRIFNKAHQVTSTAARSSNVTAAGLPSILLLPHNSNKDNTSDHRKGTTA